MKCSVPGTAKEIIESLIQDKGFSVKQLAAKLQVTANTIYRIRRGNCSQPKIHLHLIRLFLSVRREELETLTDIS